MLGQNSENRREEDGNGSPWSVSALPSEDWARWWSMVIPQSDVKMSCYTYMYYILSSGIILLTSYHLQYRLFWLANFHVADIKVFNTPLIDNWPAFLSLSDPNPYYDTFMGAINANGVRKINRYLL